MKAQFKILELYNSMEQDLEGCITKLNGKINAKNSLFIKVNKILKTNKKVKKYRISI